MTTIKFKLLGKTWKVLIFTKKQFEKRNGKSAFAITWSDRVMELHPRGTDIETIRHELVHAYQKEMCLCSVENMTNADVEEWVAELIGRRGPELMLLADSIHKRVVSSSIKKVKLKDAD